MKKIFTILLFSTLATLSTMGKTSTNFLPLKAKGCDGRQYIVQKGDRIETLFGKNWRQILRNDANLDLNNRIFSKPNGQTFVLIYEGDLICVSYGTVVNSQFGKIISEPYVKENKTAPSTSEEPITHFGTSVNVGGPEFFGPHMPPLWQWIGFVVFLIIIYTPFVYIGMRKKDNSKTA